MICFNPLVLAHPRYVTATPSGTVRTRASSRASSHATGFSYGARTVVIARKEVDPSLAEALECPTTA